MSEPTLEAREHSESFAVVRALIGSRQTVLPKRLVEPGPTTEQLDALLSLAAAAPDHGLLTPWRFIVVPPAQRHRLAAQLLYAVATEFPQPAARLAGSQSRGSAGKAGERLFNRLAGQIHRHGAAMGGLRAGSACAAAPCWNGRNIFWRS